MELFDEFGNSVGSLTEPDSGFGFLGLLFIFVGGMFILSLIYSVFFLLSYNLILSKLIIREYYLLQKIAAFFSLEAGFTEENLLMIVFAPHFGSSLLFSCLCCFKLVKMVSKKGLRAVREVHKVILSSLWLLVASNLSLHVVFIWLAARGVSISLW